MIMKKLAVLQTCFVLAGCSTTINSQKPSNHTNAQKLSFIELMETVRDNWHQAPTPELKNKVNRLMYESGLRQECLDRRCWLQYKQYRITTTDEFIVITTKNLEVKVSIDEPEKAATFLY